MIRFLGGLFLSVLLHLGVVAALLPLLALPPVPTPRAPELQLSIMAHQVERSRAESLPPPADPGQSSAPDSQTAPQLTPPHSTLGAGTLPAQALAPGAPPPPIAATIPVGPALRPGPPPAATLAARPANSQPIRLAQPQPGAITTPVAHRTDPLQPKVPASPALASAQPDATEVAASQPQSAVQPQADPRSERLDNQPGDGPSLPPQPLPAERQTAITAEGALDPLLAETIAAFLRPGDVQMSAAALGAVRDGIGSALASFPCARMQTAFDPELGQLQLRGHIPDPAMQPAVVALLQGQLGPGTPVQADLKILPRPQCQVLSGIESVGLPQSSDQHTNPRIIGPDAHARAYHFQNGQPLQLDMTAPDYNAFILVDYFDADGQVIHLQPNEHVPDRLELAKSTLTVGRASPGRPSLELTITPPYGQEIAVAFASSTALVDQPRPIREPAGPYLDWLATRVAEARAQDPDFKGEWVYFHIETGP